VLSLYQQLFDQVAGSVRSGASEVVAVVLHYGCTRLSGIQSEITGACMTSGLLAPVLRWQEAVHHNKTYGVELHSSPLSSTGCTATVSDQLRSIGHPID
jgi:hypothetical protein